MTELIQLRHATVQSLFAEVDHVVAVCQWVKDILVRNGVPLHKITLCRQGVAEDPDSSNSKLRESRPTPQSPMRMVFLGRLDEMKGVHILIHALRSMPQLALRLAIYGVAQGEAGVRYRRKLHQIAARDPRVEFHPPVLNGEVTSILQRYDLVAVPSQWLETGPLVVLEAFAAGIPVIGSRLGGISELVRDGVDGILVEPSDVNAWALALRRLSHDSTIHDALRANIRPPKRISTVAREMAALYTDVLEQRAGRHQSRTEPAV